MALSFNDNRIVAIPIYLKIVWYSKPQTMAQCIKWDYRFGENFYYLCTWGTNCVNGRINTFLSVILLPPRLTLIQLFLFRPKSHRQSRNKVGSQKKSRMSLGFERATFRFKAVFYCATVSQQGCYDGLSLCSFR